MACNSLHEPGECCCGQSPREVPSYLPRKLLRDCRQGICQFAVETTNGKDWTYSFEAERLSCSERQAKIASTACNGIMSSNVQSLATALPHVAKDANNTLRYITELGSHANSRPLLQRLLAEAPDKLTFVKHVSPHIYYGTGDGIRPSFCSHTSTTGQCYPCSLLEQHDAIMYKARASTKAESTMLATHAMIEQDVNALHTLASSSTPHQTLTGQEMRQRAAIQSHQRRADNQRSLRARYSMTDLKAQVKLFASKAAEPVEDTPELLKLFTMVTESGRSSLVHDDIVTTTPSLSCSFVSRPPKEC